ncbi:unnamed protein product [Kuraishia capsulata CBS 1993]|uniref:Large ribosomal subunit protein uL4m n=1 Tax=Kuraishia capsulata CBS 1993 TaxID=1382522 RepID=W6MGS9_9ASCO|nr:uncharacterized protein KUCA_T00000770001 [Kuraishia capsulata CBS 1993]CDK24803.1 unnamed protein product [Kuraishia capsulata CBS 1993]
MLARSTVQSVYRVLVQRASYATASTTTSAPTTHILKHAAQPPKWVLTTLRSFPSLEPHSVIPVHAKFLNSRLRRDLLWKAVIMELDNRRVGASNPMGRSERGFSRRKLAPQKGSGRARVGDANSPIRHNGSVAHARSAPNDFSTKLPYNVYASAYRIALSDFYRNGNLFVIGRSKDVEAPRLATDSFSLDIVTTQKQALLQFIAANQLQNLNLLFVADNLEEVTNLTEAAKELNQKVKILSKEEVEVKDLLRARRVFMDASSLKYFASEFAAGLV